MAWINSKQREFIGSTQECRNPLHVHGVEGRTNLGNYLPALKPFLARAIFHCICLDTPADVDLGLSDHFAVKCYHEELSAAFGKAVLLCYLHLYPEFKGHLPRAGRALRTWEKLWFTREREPLAEEAVMMLMLGALFEGELWISLAWGLCFDCLLRGQDMEGLLIDDVILGIAQIGLTLGDPLRGDSVKIGVD